MNPHRISLHEYGFIRIGPGKVSDEKFITDQEAETISIFQRRSGQSFFNIVGKKLRATNWVGSFAIGDLCIDVIPKIDTEKEPAMANLLHMVSAGGIMKFEPADISWLAKSDKPLIAAFLELYVENLRKEWLKGPIRRYVSNEANRFFLKGKIIFSRHLRENTFHHERFFTASDEFTVDNPISRLLKAALDICSKYPLGPHVSAQAKTLLCLFDEVSDERDASKCLTEITNDRTTSRFRYLINLAKSVLEMVSPWKAPLTAPVYSLMFKMNEVFEKFIAEELKRAVAGTDYEVKTQSTARHLATKTGLTRDDHKKVFWLRPDITVINHKISREKPECLIDTKWKKLRSAQNKAHKPKYFRTPENSEPVSQTDMYQMYAYAHKYRCSVILIYPHYSDMLQQTQAPACNFLQYQCGDQNQESYLIRVCTVNVTINLGKASERAKLRKSLYDLIKDPNKYR